MSYTGEHAAIINAELFDAVQTKLAANLNRRDLRKGRSDALLTSCIYDDRGNLMSPSHAVKKGVRYRYYVSTAAIQGRRAGAGSIARVPAGEIETLVLDALGKQRTNGWPDNSQERRELFKQVGLRVIVRIGTLEIAWASSLSDRQDGRAISFNDDDHADGERQRISIPYVYNAHKRHRDIILPTTLAYIKPIEQAEQHNLARSIAQGRGWLKEMMAGLTTRAIAHRERRSERMIRMTLSLAFLDPKLVEAVLHGALPRGVSTRKLVDAPMLWNDQWQAIGLMRPS